MSELATLLAKPMLASESGGPRCQLVLKLFASKVKVLILTNYQLGGKSKTELMNRNLVHGNA